MFFLRQFIIETKTLIYLSNLNHKLQSLSICKFCKNIWGWSEFEFLLRRIIYIIPDCIPTMNKPIFFVAWIYYNSLNTLQKQEPEWIICFTVHTMRRMQIFYILFTSMNENMQRFFIDLSTTTFQGLCFQGLHSYWSRLILWKDL